MCFTLFMCLPAFLSSASCFRHPLHFSGQPAAFITHNQRSMHMASGVQVVLTGAKGLDMLEKLIYLILPNQAPPAPKMMWVEMLPIQAGLAGWRVSARASVAHVRKQQL
eukprot:scaffold57076_cov18-Tisochrysis_lutea.AAC.1